MRSRSASTATRIRAGPEIEQCPDMWFRSIGYEIQEQLGEGSQGRVFKALRRDRRAGLSQTMAVKILHSETAVSLWKREFESLAKVRSEYCVQVYAFERLKGRPALVLEYVDGVSLAALGRACWLEEPEIGEILAQIELALLDLKRFGVFHGDLSPHNILVGADGRVRLLDFGLANCAGADQRFTPEFAAPERISGGPAGFAADIFSLGRVEEFLRGRVCASPYLELSPERRRLRGLDSQPEKRERLSTKVRAFQERQRQMRDLRTRTQAHTETPRRVPKAFFAAVISGCLFLGGASRGTTRAPLIRLEVRTLQWHHISLDGRPIGYSPLTIQIEGGRKHVVEWVSREGAGRRAIAPDSPPVVVLRDRDFSH